MFFRFSALLSSIAFCSSLLKEMKLMVFVFSIFIRLLSFSFFVELETAVGDTLSIWAASLWLSLSPAFMQSKEKISCSSIVHLSLYMSILLYVYKVKFIYLSISSLKCQKRIAFLSMLKNLRFLTNTPEKAHLLLLIQSPRLRNESLLFPYS